MYIYIVFLYIKGEFFLFNDLLGLKLNKRTAVRAIIFNENKLLMVKSNLGDYKLPGGGVEKGESHEEAIKREVEEETGYVIKDVKEKIGEIVERKIDIKDNEAVFEMISHYYICNIKDDIKEKNLSDYEEELGFKEQWVELEFVIDEQEKIMKLMDQIPSWINRETYVLKKIRDMFMTYKKD